MQYEILKDNPVAYYATAPNLHHDVSGNAQHLTTIGSTVVDVGLRKGATQSLYYPAGSDLVAFGYGILTPESYKKSSTIEFWFRRNCSNGFVLGREPNGFYVGDNYIRLQLNDQVIDYPVNDWNKSYHICSLFVSGSAVLFVDGYPVGDLLYEELPTQDFSISRGYLSDLALYNRPLSINRIQSHYTEGTSFMDLRNYMRLSNPRDYWFFDESKLQPVVQYKESTTEDFARGENHRVFYEDDLMTVDSYNDFEFVGEPSFSEGLNTASGYLRFNF